MFKKLLNWWKEVNSVEKELNEMGIYWLPGYFGQTFIIRAENDRQKTVQRDIKESKRIR